MMDKGVLINLPVCVQLNAPMHQNQTVLRTRCVLGLLSMQRRSVVTQSKV